MPEQPQTHRRHTGAQASLPFDMPEYDDRLAGLRDIMDLHSLDAVVLTSRQNIAYVSGLIASCSGYPSACVVTATDCVILTPDTDAGRAGRRSHGDVVSYPAGSHDSFWRAVAAVTGTGRAIGCEADHLTMVQAEHLNIHLKPGRGMDIGPATMAQRLVKSPAELALMRQAAEVADLGAAALRAEIREGSREIDLAMAGRAAMETDIARRFPDAEHAGSGAWVRSGINTDGAHDAVTNRRLRQGDILTLVCRPVIHGYATPLARTLFLGDPDPASLADWQAALATRDRALTLLQPGATCAGIAADLDAFLDGHHLLRHRIGGYGQSLGLLSHLDGRDAGLNLTGDTDTVLEPGMVIGLGPMLTLPEGQPGAGGYRLQDSVVITEDGAEAMTAFPHDPAQGTL